MFTSRADKIIFVCVVALHFLASVSLLAISTSLSLNSFDTGAPVPFGVSVLSVISHILLFPIAWPLTIAAGYLALIANSVLWAWLVVLFSRRLRAQK